LTLRNDVRPRPRHWQRAHTGAPLSMGPPRTLSVWCGLGGTLDGLLVCESEGVACPRGSQHPRGARWTGNGRLDETDDGRSHRVARGGECLLALGGSTCPRPASSRPAECPLRRVEVAPTRRYERGRTRSGPSFCARRSERAFGADRVTATARDIGSYVRVTVTTRCTERQTP
jgi:hypothetical protein